DEGEAIRRVLVALPALVAHYVALDAQLLLVQGGQHETHPLALLPQRRGKLVGGDGLVVVGAVEVGRSVIGAPDGFQDLVGILGEEESYSRCARKFRASSSSSAQIMWPIGYSR